MPMTYAYSRMRGVCTSPRVKPARRGSWLSVANGHTLRHTPGAASKSSGASGMITPHATVRPISGRQIRTPTSASTAATESARKACHAGDGRYAGRRV
ncbi:MAG TPA: hypothetical protein VLD36_19165 [Burkholderiales bacterium]|nr:hypothetical protein [Burkholderiales bacterium]